MIFLNFSLRISCSSFLILLIDNKLYSSSLFYVLQKLDEEAEINQQEQETLIEQQSETVRKVLANSIDLTDEYVVLIYRL